MKTILIFIFLSVFICAKSQKASSSLDKNGKNTLHPTANTQSPFILLPDSIYLLPLQTPADELIAENVERKRQEEEKKRQAEAVISSIDAQQQSNLKAILGVALDTMDVVSYKPGILFLRHKPKKK